MAEYIEREAAIAAAFSATSLGNSAFRDVYDTVNRLRLIPAADVAPRCPHYIRNIHDRGDDSLCEKWGCEVKDVQPVRHGRWERYEQGQPFPVGGRGTFVVSYSDWFRCSECGVGFEKKSSYCPNCGAKMDGGGE